MQEKDWIYYKLIFTLVQPEKKKKKKAQKNSNFGEK